MSCEYCKHRSQAYERRVDERGKDTYEAQRKAKNVTLLAIVRDWLVSHGYDGLCNGINECGCDLGDLMACGVPGTWCEAAHKADCSKCK